jgi:hypothetical protein
LRSGDILVNLGLEEWGYIGKFRAWGVGIYWNNVYQLRPLYHNVLYK